MNIHQEMDASSVSGVVTNSLTPKQFCPLGVSISLNVDDRLKRCD